VEISFKKGNLMSYEQAQPYFAAMKVNKPFPMAPITIIPTQEAYSYVLANAGATLPKRDPVDVRVVEQVRTGKINALKNVKLPEPRYWYNHRCDI